MAGAHQPLAYGGAQRFHQGQRGGNVYLRDGCSREESRVCQVLEVVRAGQLVVCCAELVKQAARALERHIDGLGGIVDDPDRGDEQRGDDGQALFSGPVLVVQAVLAGDEGGAEAESGIVTAFDGAHEQPQLQGVRGAAPAKIVQDGGAFDIAAHGGQVAQRLVDGVRCHGIRIDLAVEGVDAVGQYDSGPGRLSWLFRGDERAYLSPRQGAVKGHLYGRRERATIKALPTHPLLPRPYGKSPYGRRGRRGKRSSS